MNHRNEDSRALSEERMRELNAAVRQSRNNPRREFNGLRTFNTTEMERMQIFAREKLLSGQPFSWGELLRASGKVSTGSRSIYEFSGMSTFDDFLRTCALVDVADENNNSSILNELYNNALVIDEVNPNPRTGGDGVLPNQYQNRIPPYLGEIREYTLEQRNIRPRVFNGVMTFNTTEMERMKNFARETLLRGGRFNWRELLEASGKVSTGSGSIYEFRNMSTFDDFLRTCGLVDLANDDNNRDILNQLYVSGLNVRGGGRRRRKKSRKHKSLKRRRKSVRRR